MRYSFKAYTELGEGVKAKLEADSLEEAKELIEEKGLYLVSLSKSFVTLKNPFKKPDILLFTEQMTQLLKTQIPLIESLSLMQLQWTKNPLGYLLHKIKKAVESGRSLYQALELFPHFFDPFYCRIVQMGEKTAQLPLAFFHLTQELKQKKSQQKKIRAAFSYPAVLFFFCLLLIFLSFFYLLPSLENLFEGRSSSPLTRALFSLSHHLKAYKSLYLSFFILLALFGKKIGRLKTIRQQVHRLCLKLFWMKSFYITQFLYQFSKSLALLLRAKVPLLESLELCQNLSHHDFFQVFVKRCMKRVEEGYSLSEVMKNETWLTPLFPTLVAVGEKSGQLDESFEQLAKHFEDELHEQINKGIALLSPLLLLMMGLLIGILALGILLPLTDFQALVI